MSQATMPQMPAAPAERNRAATLIRLLLTALAFAVYAAAVLSLHQERNTAFANEETGPVAAALSHRLEGAPLGFLDTALFQYFMKSLAMGVPAEPAVDQARDGAVTPSGQLMIATDGIGIGGMVAVELAFRLFGPQARSLPLFYLLLLALATALFIARFRD